MTASLMTACCLPKTLAILILLLRFCHWHLIKELNSIQEDLTTWSPTKSQEIITLIIQNHFSFCLQYLSLYHIEGKVNLNSENGWLLVQKGTNCKHQKKNSQENNPEEEQTYVNRLPWIGLWQFRMLRMITLLRILKMFNGIHYINKWYNHLVKFHVMLWLPKSCDSYKKWIMSYSKIIGLRLYECVIAYASI